MEDNPICRNLEYLYSKKIHKNIKKCDLIYRESVFGQYTFGSLFLLKIIRLLIFNEHEKDCLHR